MRQIWTILIAISLGSAVGACSSTNWKCAIPDLLPKFCRTGLAAS
jgi:hypothetical protein